MISIGNNVIFSARVSLLAHDAGLKNILGLGRIGRITIGDNVFVGLGTTILPNVTIGENVIIGANSVVTHDIAPGSVCAENPARVLCSMEEYKKRILALSRTCPVFEKEQDVLKMTQAEKRMQNETLSHKIGLKKLINYEDFKSLD